MVSERVRTMRKLIAASVLAAVSGCGAGFFPLRAGVYSGELACSGQLTDDMGMMSELDFDQRLELTVEPSGVFRIDGVELAIGSRVLRSIPTAELEFEITDIQRPRMSVTVIYEPRPTLPGITVEGNLVESFRWDRESIIAASHAQLLVTDISQTVTLLGECHGQLDRR